MRNLANVIDLMLNEIPEEEEGLRLNLNKTKTSFMYSAPENHLTWWNDCAEILNNYIPSPTEDWQIDISLIFSGKINK